MMTRPQRIEYEILDCAINGARGAEGFTATLAEFLMRLRALFPGLEAPEFTDACRRLVGQNALRLRKLEKEYRGGPDDVTFFMTEPSVVFHLHSSAQSQAYFRELSAFIDMPGKFKRHPGPTSSEA